MAKDERLYARFDIGMDEHPKILLLSDAAFRALHEATYYSRRQLTDGFLDRRVALKKWGAEVIAELSSNHPERPSLIRVDEGWEIRDYAEHQITRADIEKKREAGRAGGLAKAKQQASKSVAPASPVLQQNSGTSLAKRETEKEKEINNTSSPTAMEVSFAEAWSHWPKKVERKKAVEQFTKASKKVAPELLKAHVIRFGDAYAATTEKQFVPALGVWLGRERWTDELPRGTTQQKKAGGTDWALRM